MASRMRSPAAPSRFRPRGSGAMGLALALPVFAALPLLAALSLAPAFAADELGLDGPAVAPLDSAVFTARDLRSDEPPLFAIAPDAAPAAVFLPADLAPATVAAEAGPARAAEAEQALVAPPHAVADAAPFAAPLDNPLLVAALSPRGAPPPFAAAPASVAPAPSPAFPVAAAPATVLPAVPAPVADAPAPVVAAITPASLRQALVARLADPGLRGRALAAQRKAREELAQAYAARGDAPAWVTPSGWSAAARGAFERLTLAREDGLDLGAAALAALGEPTLEGELRLSEAVVAYARQAAGGRVEPWRVAALITAKPPQIEASAALARVGAAASAGDASQALRSFNPPHPGYVALRDKLAELRAAPQTEAPAPIPGGPTLKVGMRDARVPALRARLGLAPLAEGEAAPLYDADLARAVQAFQRGAGLTASGRLTPLTVAALSGDETSRVEQEIVANMERWRWLPRDLGAARVEVNIPDYALALKEGERTTLAARVVVGKPESPTPVFSDRMRFLVVNPSWTLPPSILENEALPNLAADPDYYAKRGYEVTWRNGKPSVRQPPGERNALGHIKFMFPNDHAVYLHDTPQRGLFAQSKRAYSHGCVRVDQPFRLAEAVLGGRYSEAALKKMIGARERNIPLDEPLPIHLTYFTARVEADGRLALSEDIYGYSRRLRAAMGLDGAVAALAPADAGARPTGGASTERAGARKARAARRAATDVAASEPVVERRAARPSSVFGWFSQGGAAREPSLSGR